MTLKAPPKKRNTIAVIVLFNPDIFLKEGINNLLPQIDHLFVIANDNISINKRPFLKSQNISYFRKHNIGLARALNLGIKKALKLKYNWCLLLDQDTMIVQNFIHHISVSFNKIENKSIVGMLVPNYEDIGTHTKFYKSKENIFEVNCAITSGSLIALNLIKNIGLMNQDFFIEGIDTDFSLRLRKCGYKIYGIKKVLMFHSAGETSKEKFFGKVFLVTNHEAYRYFFQYRNLYINILNNIFFDPRWAFTSLVNSFKKILIILVFEKKKIYKLWLILKGIIFGLFRI